MYNNGYLYKDKNVFNNIKQMYFHRNKYFNSNQIFNYFTKKMLINCFG